MSHNTPDSDPKVRATATIWGCAIGMFGICIPLVAITKSGVVLPLMVLLGAGGGTAAVWLAADKRQLESSQLAQTVQALEERVMNPQDFARNWRANFGACCFIPQFRQFGLSAGNAGIVHLE